MSGLQRANLQKNPERIEVLKGKIERGDKIELTNGNEVVLNYDGINIKKIFIDSSYSDIPSGPLFFIKDTETLIKLDDIKKTAEFGSSKGSGGGASATATTESMCCYFAAYLMNSNINSLEFVDNKTLTKHYIALSKFFKKKENLVHTYNKTTRFNFEGLWEQAPKDEEWMNTYVNTANIIKKKATKFKGYVYFHRGSLFMDSIYDRKKRCQKHDKKLKRADPSVSAVPTDTLHDDKWNPGDIWMSTVKPTDEPFPWTPPDYSKQRTNHMCDWSGLKTAVYKSYTSGQTLGISLKKTGRSGSLKEFNTKDRTQNLGISYVGYIFGNGDFFNSVDVYLLFNNGKIQFRPTATTASWQGEVKGTKASGGKASGGPTNYYVEQYFNKSIGHSAVVSEWKEMKDNVKKSNNLTSKLYNLYVKYNGKQKGALNTTLSLPIDYSGPYDKLNKKDWIIVPKNNKINIWTSAKVNVSIDDFKILADNYTHNKKNASEAFYFGKYMAVSFIDAINSNNKQKQDAFSQDLVRYAMSNIDDVSTYFWKIS